MNLQELNRHFELRERLEKAEELLSALRAAACPRAHVITGMPHTGGVNDRVGDLAVEIADLEAQTKSLQDKIAEKEATIPRWIRWRRASKQCGNVDTIVVDGKGRLPMRRLLPGGCSSRRR